MRSMTGFGQAASEGRGGRYSVEVRGVNHRFLDVRLAVPRDSQSWEPELKPLVAEMVERGKVDVTISRVAGAAAEKRVEVDEELAKSALQAWRKLQKGLGLAGEIDVGFLLSRSEFVRVTEARADPGDDLPQVRKLLAKALRSFDKARVREGAALQADMKARCTRLAGIEKDLRKRSADIVPELAARLRGRLNKLLEGQQIDEQRLLQETAVMAERCDVHEELVRLASHLKRLAGLVRQKGSVGKPIDFLLQEVHRELNTIASKSSDVEVTRLTLDGRAEVEKLREQTQNVE